MREVCWFGGFTKRFQNPGGEVHDNSGCHHNGKDNRKIGAHRVMSHACLGGIKERDKLGIFHGSAGEHHNESENNNKKQAKLVNLARVVGEFADVHRLLLYQVIEISERASYIRRISYRNVLPAIFPLLKPPG